MFFRAVTRADLATRGARGAGPARRRRFTIDAAAIREALTESINGAADVLTVIGLVGSMVCLDWLMSLIAAAMYPIAIVPILRLGKRIRRASGGMQERMGETAAQLHRKLRRGPGGPRLPAGGAGGSARRAAPSPSCGRPAAHRPHPGQPRPDAGGAGRRRRRRRDGLRRLAGGARPGDDRRVHRLRRGAADRRRGRCARSAR